MISDAMLSIARVVFWAAAGVLALNVLMLLWEAAR